MFTSNDRVFIQVQLVVMISAPSEMNRNKGRRLTKNASLTAVLTCLMAQFWGFGVGESVVSKG